MHITLLWDIKSFLGIGVNTWAIILSFVIAGIIIHFIRRHEQKNIEEGEKIVDEAMQKESRY